MPYRTNTQLNKAMPGTKALPAKAQTIYRHAFNTTVATLEKKGVKNADARAAQAGWGAVKKAGFKKTAKTGKWVKKA